VAAILERRIAPTIAERLKRVNLVPTLTSVALNDADRTGHVPPLFKDLISRLRPDRAAQSPFPSPPHANGKFCVGLLCVHAS
jgi:hypothetical protein